MRTGEDTMSGVHPSVAADHGMFYTEATKVHGIHLRDHKTASSCITLEEFQRRRAAGLA